MDSTNLSANQASYPLISPDGVNSIRAPKKENWTAIRETIFFVLFVDQGVDPEFQYVKSHLLQLIYLKYNFFHFTHNIALLSVIRTKSSTKIVQIKNYRAFTCVYNLVI